MSIRTVLVVMLALVFGGSAAVGINTLRNAPPTTPKAETVTVVVAAADVPRFTTISADLLKTHDYPKDLVPPGALTSVEEAVDRASYSPLVKDEPLLNSKLAPRGAGRGMAAIIKPGMRACTIQIPTISAGVAGFILAGNKVDVLCSQNRFGANDAAGGVRTITLLQDVEILAVDQRSEAPAENKVDAKELRSVTLLVTPEQAEKLAEGQNKGVLHLSLRNPEDRGKQMKPVEIVREKPKLEKEEKAAPRPPAQIRTLRGVNEGSVLVYPVVNP